jgi:acyl carrier protein
MEPTMPLDIEAAVREFIADNFLFREGRDQVSDTESLLEGGLMDSTGVLELVAFIESDLGIAVADADIVPENLDSIARITAFARSKLAQAA